MVRIIAPILRAVDKPWKLYPVGVLFGFGESSFCNMGVTGDGGRIEKSIS
jgi:high-affinity nickel permease